MSHITNPKNYWKRAHDDPANTVFNSDIEYFFQYPYSQVPRIYNVIDHINNHPTNFNYITGYKPYNNKLNSLNNIIIDYSNKKIILIPNFVSIDDTRAYNPKNCIKFNTFIKINFELIPSDKFIKFINANHFRFIFIINNFIDIIDKCERNNSIKFTIDLIDYKISYTIVQVQPPPLVPILPLAPPPVTLSIPQQVVRGPPPLVKIEDGKIFFNFDDPKNLPMKNKILQILTEIPTTNQLVWLNRFYDNIMQYDMFITLLKQNKNLIIVNNTIMIREQPKPHSKVTLNPEDDDVIASVPIPTPEPVTELNDISSLAHMCNLNPTAKEFFPWNID